jgi:hypothetical protein
MITRPASQVVAFAVPHIHEVEPRKVENNEVDLYRAGTRTTPPVVPKLNNQTECLQSCVFVERSCPMLLFVSYGTNENVLNGHTRIR